MTAYQAGIRDGVISATNIGPLVSAAVAGMAFSGGGVAKLPGGGTQDNTLPTTTGSRTAVSIGNATNTSANEVSAVVDTRKFSDYIFKPGADQRIKRSRAAQAP